MSDKLKQGTLFEMKKETQTGPVTCLGLTFENDDARRAYFTEELRKKLPELKEIEGFPIGEDEDILALSDPPYYTACPNPWIEDFIHEWSTGRNAEVDEYHREPFAADVEEGKNDPVYNVHSYHTKVPYKAIMKYILHYTDPGDIIFDGFSGTGMTGVAAQMCSDKELVQKLGFPVKNSGERRAVLSDLSPIASYISYNYNKSFHLKEFNRMTQEISKHLDLACSWMYETYHKDTNEPTIKKGQINFVIWSDVFSCNECSGEIVFWNEAIDRDKGEVKKEIKCPHCLSINTKNKYEHIWESKFDNEIQKVTRRAKQVPVLINYTYNNKTYEKSPDQFDLQLIERIENYDITDWVPTEELKNGVNTNQPKGSHGVTNIHHFYTKRNLIALAKLFSLGKRYNNSTINFLVSSMINRATQMNRIHLKNYFFGGGGYNAGYLKGTLYISSIPIETSIIKQLSDRIKAFNRGMLSYEKNGNVIIGTNSITATTPIENSVDYIFTDPPFGANIMYSELNCIWESWLKLSTNNSEEAIMNQVQDKGIKEYQNLMLESFKEYYNILKPGRWMTVEFSNSQASVWNAIREAIEKAGFVIANVAALDKKQGSFKAVTTTSAVKQDLVISAYKPKKLFVEKISREQNTEESAWTFVKQHLEQLPVYIGVKGSADIIVERTPRILFDRMVAFHVQNGYPVPISSADFQLGVEQRFPMRDGMAFLETQVPEYDKKRILAKEFTQMSLFVSDENSAIEWLRQQLMKKPQTRQEIHPNFMKEIQHIAKHEILPELDALLEQNFLRYDGVDDVPSQIHTYLSTDYKDLRNLSKNDPALKLKAKDRWYVPDPNKQADLEKLREKSLLREFETYRDELIGNRKKLKQFRTEAIRAGFKKAWGEKDYQTIVTIGERLPENVLQEDDKLLMYYDNAQIRLGL
ncbi:DNA methyltransferase [Paenibacillus urinalis]|uniref:DNA methyltransferase n=1 Tax=Paenibacillus urinalis TaxID=521520 RepID=A0AAX3N1B3_9BACL|nr:DNA methyltransferase [Paenibacillus urinalis]WDH83312.1 DNA methyltransferase [Paenibacillus urinalis]